MFDSPAIPALFEIADQLALKPPVKLFAQEPHHILGTKVQYVMVDQFSVQWRQGAAVCENDIGRVFALIANPVVSLLAADPA